MFMDLSEVGNEYSFEEEEKLVNSDDIIRLLFREKIFIKWDSVFLVIIILEIV